LQARFEKKKPKDEKKQEDFLRHPLTWASSAEDDEEVFTPRSLAKSNEYFKGKSAASACVDSDDDFMPPSKKGKASSSSKSKKKGKSEAYNVTRSVYFKLWCWQCRCIFISLVT
jgi:hypothetical protein